MVCSQMKFHQHFGGTHRLLLIGFFLTYSTHNMYHMLHDVISQKTDPLMVTTVRTSDSTYSGLSGREQQLILPIFSTHINIWYFNHTAN